MGLFSGKAATSGAHGGETRDIKLAGSLSTLPKSGSALIETIRSAAGCLEIAKNRAGNAWGADRRCGGAAFQATLNLCRGDARRAQRRIAAAAGVTSTCPRRMSKQKRLDPEGDGPSGQEPHNPPASPSAQLMSGSMMVLDSPPHALLRAR